MQGLFKHKNFSPVVFSIKSYLAFLIFWNTDPPFDCLPASLCIKKIIANLFTTVMLKKWRSLSVLMKAAFKVFRKKTTGGWITSPPLWVRTHCYRIFKLIIIKNSSLPGILWCEQIIIMPGWSRQNWNLKQKDLIVQIFHPKDAFLIVFEALSLCHKFSTVVGDYINILKASFDFNFVSY